MRVLLVNNYWYLRGGAERVVLDTKSLLENRGHEVEIFGMQHPLNVFTRDYFASNSDFGAVSGINKIKIGLRVIYNRDARRKFEQVIRRFKPDVIHYHDICHHLSFSLLDASHRLRVPSVMTLHNYKIVSPNYNLFHHGRVREESKGGRYYHCLLNNCMENVGKSFVATIEAYWRRWRRYNNMVDYYIAPSEFLKRVVVSYGLPAEKIAILSDPVDVDQFQISEHDEDGVVFFGRLSAEKGVDIFLKAAVLNPHIRHLVVGGGPQEERLKEMAGKNVGFVKFQSGVKLTDLLARARVVVVPSVWYEVSGLAVLEAKAMGKIVLGSDIGAIPESLSPEFLFPAKDSRALADKINFWYSQPWSDRLAIGRRGREDVLRKHEPVLYVKQLEQLYEKARK